MRFHDLYFGSVLGLLLCSCAGDEDLAEGRGAQTDTGSATEYEASPSDDASPDTSVEMDSGATPDTGLADTSPVDTGTLSVDSSVPETTTGCTSPNDCAGTDGECGRRTCAAGKCGFAPTAADTKTTMQTPGDCKMIVCDGAGGTKLSDDPSDVPADKNECSTGTCAASAPAQTPKASGTSCTIGGSVCDGAGKCVGCLTASTCPGTDGECATRTCASNTCAMSYASDFTFTFLQTPGDCKMRQCDGKGGVRTVVWTPDVPASDGNPCTQECCTAAGDPSSCMVPAGTKCNATTCSTTRIGVCGECNVVADCPVVQCKNKSSCTGNRCTYTNAPDNTPCGAPGWWCYSGSCLAPIG